MLIFQLLAIVPFLLLFFLLLKTSLKVYKVMLIVYSITLILLLIVWQSAFSLLFLASIKGFFIGFEIFLIIFSILLLFNLLKKSGKINTIQKFLKSFSDDINIQIILIGFFLVLFFESIAGFGTPAAVCAPLLVYLGVRPLTAVIICLISDTFAVVFGAFGTPIVKGIGSFTSVENLSIISIQTGIIIGISSILVPIILLFIYSKLEKKEIRLTKYIPFCLVSGGLYGSLLILFVHILPLEIPAVIASLFSLIIIGTLLKLGIFTKVKYKADINKKAIVLSLLPYLVIICLFFMKSFITIPDIQIVFSEIVTHSFSLTTPGIIIGLVAIIFTLLYLDTKNINKVVLDSLTQGKTPFLTLIFTLAFVQLLIYSSINPANISSIPYLVASLFEKTGVMYLFFAPMIGAFGAFLTGSVTVSNLLFIPLQDSAANLNSLPSNVVLSLQVLGGGAGNMIAIHNIVAALAVVNISNGVKKILKILILGVIGLCLLFSILAFLLFI